MVDSYSDILSRSQDSASLTSLPPSQPKISRQGLNSDQVVIYSVAINTELPPKVLRFQPFPIQCLVRLVTISQPRKAKSENSRVSMSSLLACEAEIDTASLLPHPSNETDLHPVISGRTRHSCDGSRACVSTLRTQSLLEMQNLGAH